MRETGALLITANRGDTPMEGWLVPAGDVGALAKALVCLFESADLRCRWGGRGRVQAETRYQWPDVVTRLEDCIEQAIGR